MQSTDTRKVRATSRDKAVEEVLSRAGINESDLVNARAELCKKGYTAKLDKSESTEKRVEYSVISDRSNWGGWGRVLTPEVAEQVPDELVLSATLEGDGYIYDGPEGQYDSFRAARSAVMTHFALFPEDDTEYEVRTEKTRAEKTKFSAREVASEVPTWNVTITFEQ